MTRMERKMRRRHAIINVLIVIMVFVTLVLAGNTLSEAAQAREMLKEAETTDFMAKVVMANARSALVKLEAENRSPHA